MGRFLNADSLGGETGDLGSHNIFVYCLNNPVNMEDPTGHIAVSTVILLVSLAIGAAVAADTAVQTKQQTGSVDWNQTLLNGCCAFGTVYTFGMSAYSVYSSGYVPFFRPSIKVK
jgi:hypothetical protein